MTRQPVTDGCQVGVRRDQRWYAAMVWLAVCGLAADWAGLHYMVGAFLAGVVMDAHWFDQKKMDLLRHHLLLTVMPGLQAPGVQAPGLQVPGGQVLGRQVPGGQVPGVQVPGVLASLRLL